MRTGNMSIKVGFTCGTDIKDAASEAVSLATRMGCMVKFDFNSVSCTVYPSGDPEQLCREYNEALTKDHPANKLKMAFAQTITQKKFRSA